MADDDLSTDILRRLEPVIARRAPEVAEVLVSLTVTPEGATRPMSWCGIGEVKRNVALYASEKGEGTALAGAVASLLPPGTDRASFELLLLGLDGDGGEIRRLWSVGHFELERQTRRDLSRDLDKPQVAPHRMILHAGPGSDARALGHIDRLELVIGS